jgi:hypothetical protein
MLRPRERCSGRHLVASFTDYMRYLEKKRVRNAEVLVPNLVPSEYVAGCYVDTQEKRRACLERENLPAVDVRRGIFFK